MTTRHKIIPAAASVTRREFITRSALLSGAVFAVGGVDSRAAATTGVAPSLIPDATVPDGTVLDLAPAQWLWYPSERTLPNTFILFRRVVKLNGKPRSARGWILADSRYRLEVNGQRVQWGPAPCDPRWAEADPLDIAELLADGENVIAVTVLYFGHGDGTWAMGKPGFIFRLELEQADGQRELIISDQTWHCHLSQAWPAGQHQRWFLRALQEQFDARLHPVGWLMPGFAVDASWLAPQVLNCMADKPSFCSKNRDILSGLTVSDADAKVMHLRRRSIPHMRESWIRASKLSVQHRIEWLRPIAEYFAVRAPNAWRAEVGTYGQSVGEGMWRVDLDPLRGTALTFEITEQVIGWPGFTIEAPAGTTIELMTHEAHDINGPEVINSSFHFWSRFVCREGINHFEGFDFDSLRWIQLHLHPGQGSVTVSQVGVRRRVYPWPQEPKITTSEAGMQKLFDAAVNTLRNCAQEALVDGMGRERQQYSGDIAHQQHAINLLCDGSRQVARFLATYSQGIALDGYFLDCWPGVDRLARLAQRQLRATSWGPLLDHGVQFVFDCWNHYLYTGRLDDVREAYPRLLKFAGYLRGCLSNDGLLPVENTGVPWVWLDWSTCYRQQRHKQCAFNLYVAAMFKSGLAPLCRAFGNVREADESEAFAGLLLDGTRKRFWSVSEQVFVDNLPWLAEEHGSRYSDRTLATSVLFDQCPAGSTVAAVRLLTEPTDAVGLSYPNNACWRMWALAQTGHTATVLKEFRERWATLDSVRLNNTIPEFFKCKPDGTDQWSHATVAPLYIAAMSFAGIKALQPGFSRYEIRPQLADLPSLNLRVTTPRGIIEFSSRGLIGARELVLTLPPGAAGEIVVHRDERVSLPAGSYPGHFVLPSSQTVRLMLEHT